MRDARQQQAEPAQRVAGRRHLAVAAYGRRLVLDLAARLAQQQRQAGDRGEQDKLLAQRVEAAVVEVHGAGHVGHVPLARRRRR